MRLKTKLVLAITLLVFLIAGLLSLVYVSQLLQAAVQQSYDTNDMVAEQIRFALQNALEAGLKDQKVDPNDPAQLRALMTGGGARQCGAAGRRRVGQPLLAHRLRHQHRRQPFHHAAEHQS
jgi:hypothetical protein